MFVQPFQPYRLTVRAMLICLLCWTAGCNTPLQPQPTETPLLPQYAETTLEGNLKPTWQPLQKGIDYLLFNAVSNHKQTQLNVVRINLSQHTIKIHYTTDTPLSIKEWAETTQAELTVNGGFFDHDNRATALVIVDGKSSGQSYQGYGGMLIIKNNTPTLQWLVQQPYRHDPNIHYALQGTPMLVYNKEANTLIQDDQARSRRTFVAIDQQGYLLLGVSFNRAWTITELAHFLAYSKVLEIKHALNLDGGASTGLWVKTDKPDIKQAQANLNSIEKVPMVISIYPKTLKLTTAIKIPFSNISN